VNNESIVFHSTWGGSDKVYSLELQEVQGGWVVNYRNGRRVPGAGYQISGSAGGTKTATPQPYESALRTYNNEIRERERKHYVVVARSSAAVPGGEAASGPLPVHAQEERASSGKCPMFLIAIEDEAKAIQLCDNPSYCGQEKEDGERRMLLKDTTDVRGINRNGEFVPIPEVMRNAADFVSLGAFLLDGEQIGETLRVWDLLEQSGEDLRQQPMRVRYERLAMAVPNRYNFAIQVVPTAFTRAAKLAMFHDIKARGGEGMVFKLVAAPYEEGRSKYALKYKFKAMATVQVVGVSANKRSVQMGAVAEEGVQFVGNVTIPSNKEIPTVGQFAEVEYLYAFPNGGSLFQPVYLGARADKNEADRYDSLKFKRSVNGDSDEG
jgi:bifunctional non-homologous end joining protein LigD